MPGPAPCGSGKIARSESRSLSLPSCVIRLTPPSPATAPGTTRAGPQNCPQDSTAHRIRPSSATVPVRGRETFSLRQAARAGGPWLFRVRCLSGLVAVVVPSGCKVRCQPQRWMAVRWWKAQSKDQVRQAGGAAEAAGCEVVGLAGGGALAAAGKWRFAALDCPSAMAPITGGGGGQERRQRDPAGCAENDVRPQ